ncbi:hypothetical protein BLNAU_14955 [Blattamonas nauphoetae]|uniref:Uncharacterized protein n=1 Tax=Blattamonas nauphoetae TaxID=2049346 RepID=A0ABQ9XCC0_9EUKA|nr:hypothetical protein BLNAU_14955 [Blattamonas nauphoetae]
MKPNVLPPSIQLQPLPPPFGLQQQPINPLNRSLPNLPPLPPIEQKQAPTPNIFINPESPEPFISSQNSPILPFGSTSPGYFDSSTPTPDSMSSPFHFFESLPIQLPFPLQQCFHIQLPD